MIYFQKGESTLKPLHSWELTYPHPFGTVEDDDFPLTKVGIFDSFFRGYFWVPAVSFPACGIHIYPAIQNTGAYDRVYLYLEPVNVLYFWGFNPPKDGLFQSQQGSFGSRYV